MRPSSMRPSRLAYEGAHFLGTLATLIATEAVGCVTQTALGVWEGVAETLREERAARPAPPPDPVPDPVPVPDPARPWHARLRWSWHAAQAPRAVRLPEEMPAGAPAPQGDTP